MKSLSCSIIMFVVASLMWAGTAAAADEGDTQYELVKLCDANAVRLQNVLKLKNSGYTLEQAQESIKAYVDRRVESFMRVSVELAYQNADDVTHALETRAWHKTCVDEARKH
jgi:hypothetical protein